MGMSNQLEQDDFHTQILSLEESDPQNVIDSLNLAIEHAENWKLQGNRPCVRWWYQKNGYASPAMIFSETIAIDGLQTIVRMNKRQASLMYLIELAGANFMPLIDRGNLELGDHDFLDLWRAKVTELEATL